MDFWVINMIKPIKWQQLRDRMQVLGIIESDLEEKFTAGSGSGGQKVNKSSTCVRLSHAKTGVTIKCQKTRSREDNRFFARRLLCDQVECATMGKQSETQQLAAKIKKQKSRRRRRQDK
jgi:peptide chain release factor